MIEAFDPPNVVEDDRAFGSLSGRIERAQPNLDLLPGGEMLRIYRSANEEVVFKLSGRIDKENIAELQAQVGAEVSGLHMVLDLKDVTLVGQDGVTFLAECEGADIALANCPPYVREWIRRQRNGK